ncbi:MAG: hypothetical protein HOP21_03955 [Methylotenera sp.]|nr:hypothetical protein [Methylotenera sp.]
MKTHTSKVPALFLTVGLVTSYSAFGKDVDVQLFLNQKLASKPLLKFSKPVSVTTKVCTTETKRIRCGGGGRISPEGGCADNFYEATVCKDATTTSVQTYEDSASVKTTQIVKVGNLVFDENQMVTLPERGLFSSTDYQNCDDVTLSQTVSLSVSGNKGFSVAKGESITTTKAGSISLSGKFFGGSASTSLSISESVGLSSQTSESSSDTVTRTSSTTVSIPPKRSGRFEVLAYETTIEIPFSATVVVDGELAPNDSGITMANQLMNENERTLPFSGILRITNVSNANIRTIPAPKPNQCKDSEKALTLMSQPFVSIPAKSIPKETKKEFLPQKTLFSKFKTTAMHSFSVGSLAGTPQIGAEDGIKYEIISVADVANPTPSCGFNDLGLMNLGIFSVETRRYTQYSDGNIVSSWIDKIETFKSCWPL